MAKVRVRKDIAEQMTVKLKTPKIEIIKPKFAEKLQKSTLNSQNKQITSKLQSNKNLFSRGDFDDYKIKNMGVAPDGCVYDLDNPTEKFYYDLKMQFAKADNEVEKTLFNVDWDEILKSHKYSRKYFKNGKYHYVYNRHNNFSRIPQCKEQPLNLKIDTRLDDEYMVSILVDQAIDYIDNVWMKDWKKHPEKSICKELRNKKIVFSDISYTHIWKKSEKKLQEENKDKKIIETRTPKEIVSHIRYLPNAKEILENGVWTSSSYHKLDEPYTDKESGKKVIGYIYQDLCGLNPNSNSKSKYIQVSVSFSKYSDNTYSDTVYISVAPRKENDIKKSMEENPCFRSETAIWGQRPLLTNNSNIAHCDNLSSKNVSKSLTYSGHKLQGRTRLYGMDISIENKKGSYRSGTDKDGHKWKTLMHYDYGYIRGTVGVDKDHLDLYIGPDKEAQKVYVIHQNNPVTHKYDEDKCMLCFSSAADAKAAYMKQYDRPGFYGSMTTMTIEQFKSFIFSHKGKMVHKSFDINITDITENNKQQKLEQVNKALNAIADNRPFMIKHIPADSSTNYGNLLVRITDFDRSKIEKAVHKIALSLDADISGASKGEAFVYKSQEEIVDKFFKDFTNKTRAVYNFVISYFDLPDIRIVSKAGELRHKGKILYNPETGLPIKESEWKRFIVELEKFLNRNYSGIGEKIVLSAESLGIILDRLSKTNSLEAIRKMSVADLKAKRYDVDWISESVKTMKDKFGDVISRERQARIQIAMDSAAQRVTKVKDDMRNNIQQIIIDGIRDKQSKSVVAQNLFDKCASLNRDMQRIADSEVQMASNSSYCKEEVYNSKPDEKVYFKRFEMIDDNTCKKCKKLNGTIVLWSDVPLPDEHIKDPIAKYAIWEGKNDGDCPVGIVHPWCRGAWIRYYPEV